MRPESRLIWFAVWLLLGLVVRAFLLASAAAIVESHSAIVSLTAAPGGTEKPAASAPLSVVAQLSPGLPRGTGAEADHEAPAVRRPPTRSAAALFFVGVASTSGPGWPASLVALPQGPGWRFRVCGQGGCLVLTSTDKGPDQRLFPDRIVDLPLWAFERVSGQPWTRGITTVSLVILGRTP